MRRVCLGCRVFVAAAVAVAATTAQAGIVVGRLDLQPPPRPEAPVRGFLDPIENPLTTMPRYSPASQMVVVLEGDEKPVSPGQVTWELVGESFGRPVLAAPAGAEVVIKNVSHIPRMLSAVEDPKLVVGGLLNPTGGFTVRVPDAGKVYTITGGKDAPYLRGKLVVVNTTYIAYPDENGRFEIADVRPGNYKVRIWYRDGWLEQPADSVDVAAKGRTEIAPKIPPTAFQTPKK